mmetsp:Transcript_115868/g.308104  ORF Transcript_115868/g.308104 Transcript_115868/m.308104 type:complete len:212 (+) Transcript_115868:236-871(+)
METQASLGFRVTTTIFAPPHPDAPPLQGAISTVACVLKTRLGGASSSRPSRARPSHDISSLRLIVFPRLLALPVLRQTVASIQGACSMGAVTLDTSPPYSRERRICCIHVVPHLGQVATTMSSRRSSKSRWSSSTHLLVTKGGCGTPRTTARKKPISSSNAGRSTGSSAHCGPGPGMHRAATPKAAATPLLDASAEVPLADDADLAAHWWE